MYTHTHKYIGEDRVRKREKRNIVVVANELGATLG